MARLIYIGSRPRCPITWRDSTDAAADPSTITVAYTPPGGATVTKTANWNGSALSGDPEIVRDGVGRYHIDIAVTVAGLWKVKWTATGALVAAKNYAFTVQAD